MEKRNVKLIIKYDQILKMKVIEGRRKSTVELGAETHSRLGVDLGEQSNHQPVPREISWTHTKGAIMVSGWTTVPKGRRAPSLETQAVTNHRRSLLW